LVTPRGGFVSPPRGLSLYELDSYLESAIDGTTGLRRDRFSSDSARRLPRFYASELAGPAF